MIWFFMVDQFLERAHAVHDAATVDWGSQAGGLGAGGILHLPAENSKGVGHRRLAGPNSVCASSGKRLGRRACFDQYKQNRVRLVD